MKRLLTALVLIPLVLLAVFRAPDWLFILLVGGVALLATIEYLQIVAAYGVTVFRWTTLAAVGGLFVVPMLIAMEWYVIGEPSEGTAILGLIVPACFIAPSFFLATGMRETDLKTVLPG